MNVQFPTRSRWWNGPVRKFASSTPGSWVFGPLLHHLDRWMLALSGGQNTFSLVLSGLPIVIVTTKGARSGQPRTVPLLALPDGEKFVLIASNWGKSHHPAWYYNLRANPTATITYRNESQEYTARPATPAERDAYWQQALQVYPGYSAYKARAGTRQIEMFVLSPVLP